MWLVTEVNIVEVRPFATIVRLCVTTDVRWTIDSLMVMSRGIRQDRHADPSGHHLNATAAPSLGRRSWHSKVAVCASTRHLLHAFHDIVLFNSKRTTSLQLLWFQVTLSSPATSISVLPNQA